MSISNKQLLAFIKKVLQPEKVKDYCPNGLQVEGKEHISKMVTGVTASQALIDRAIAVGADAILVHHGYFWKGESPCLTGMKRKRIESLLKHNINLFAYHLPLDIHPELGNNAQLAKRLKLKDMQPIEEVSPCGVLMQGSFNNPVSADYVTDLLSKQLDKIPLHEPANKPKISTVAWCTGGGQGYIDVAADNGIDGFITGEVSEQTVHTAREMNIHFFAAGHHATERYGVKALGEYIQQELGIESIFVDIDNPA